MAWAAYQDMQVGDSNIKQPISNACEKCYTTAIDIIRYKNYKSFLEDLEADPEGMAEKLATIDKNLAKSGSAVTWPKVEASGNIKYEVEVSATFRGYLDGSLKSALGVSRLTAKLLTGVPVVSAPSLASPGELQQLHLFKREGPYSDKDEGHDVVVRAKADFSKFTEFLSRGDNLFEGHGQAELERAMGMSEWQPGVTEAINKKSLLSMEAFVSQHKATSTNAKARPSLGPKLGVSGVGACDLEVQNQSIQQLGEDGKAEVFHADLTDNAVKSRATPKKPRLGKSSGSVCDGIDGSDEEFSGEDDCVSGDFGG